jgi:hypothetical protein
MLSVPRRGRTATLRVSAGQEGCAGYRCPFLWWALRTAPQSLSDALRDATAGRCGFQCIRAPHRFAPEGVNSSKHQSRSVTTAWSEALEHSTECTDQVSRSGEGVAMRRASGFMPKFRNTGFLAFFSVANPLSTTVRPRHEPARRCRGSSPPEPGPPQLVFQLCQLGDVVDTGDLGRVTAAGIR